MITSLPSDELTRSVLAVPPLARGADGGLAEEPNRRLIRHIEAGGVRTLLYGGNANFYHLPLSEYDQVLGFLASAAGERTLVIPSLGPAWGMAIDQARIFRSYRFPTVMLLPQVGVTTSGGVAEGVRRLADAAGVPILLYIKNDGYIEPPDVAPLARDGTISGIKYATVRSYTADDDYLRRLVDAVDRRLIISGIGEQPAIIHLNDFGLGGFTSGCVCVAPALSSRMLAALRAGDVATAETIRRQFAPLEDLRNEINPIRVLHEAVRLAGIADTGPLQPLLTNVDAHHHEAIGRAARALADLEISARRAS